MKFKSVFAAIAVLACGTAANAAPIEAYGRLPQIEDVALSPDGKLVALITTDGEKRSVLIREAGSNVGRASVTAGNMKLRDLQFADPTHLLITYSVTSSINDVIAARSEHFMTIIYDLTANKTAPLFKEVKSETLNVTIGSPVVRLQDGKPVILVHGVEFVESEGRISLFRTDPTSTRTSIVETGSSSTRRFLVDEGGKAMARTDYDERRQHWSISVQTKNSWHVVAQGDNALGAPALIGPARTPGALLVAIDSEDGAVYRELTIADGTWSPPLPYKETDSFLRNRAGKMIGIVSYAGDDLKYSFFDPADEAIWQSIVRAYPGQEVQLTSWSDDHKKVVVRVDSKTEGPAYALVDLNTKKADWIGNEYLGIGPADIAEMKPIHYAAKDGLDIPGYLTLPKGKAAKNLPLVVLVHGGPASRDSLGFDWWSQALAAQGYAVLQANYRGSDGLGVKFLEAGHGEFGKKMQTDLSDGVRWLASEGTIDPKRVCIVGASYGGYAALAGATLDADVYRCAVSVAGISDLGRMLKTERRDSGDATFRYWSTFIGVESAKDPELTAISPIRQVANVKAPILLVHGKDDTVVLYEQSRMMVEALKKADKPVEFITLEGEDHWLSKGATRQQMLKATVDFLIKNNPPN